MVKNVAVVSLSAGVLGESFAKHELDIGAKRLADYGLNVRFMPHALAGIEYIKNHPEDRAADLLAAFRDPEIDMILCAIGGDDTVLRRTSLQTVSSRPPFPARTRYFSAFRIRPSTI